MGSFLPSSKHLPLLMYLRVPKPKGTISCWSQVPLPPPPTGLSITPAFPAPVLGVLLIACLQTSPSPQSFSCTHFSCTGAGSFPKLPHPQLPLTLYHPYTVNLNPHLTAQRWVHPPAWAENLQRAPYEEVKGGLGLHFYLLSMQRSCLSGPD